jgi:hypothetical protein
MLRKFRIPEIVLGALMATAVFAMGMVFYSSRHPPQQSEQQSSAKRPAKKADNVSDAEKADDRIARYTLWLAVLTGGLVLMAGIQGYFLLRADKTARISADAARISAEAAKASAESVPNVERAYVFLRIERISFQLRRIDTPSMRSPASSLSARFNFVNHGKTPAVIREIRAGVRRLPGDLPEDAWVEEARFPLAVNVLGSGQAFEGGGFQVGDEEAMTDDAADLITAGGLFIYFYGHLVYQDVFGNDRETQFCWRLTREHLEEWGGRAHNYRT